jgi:hypothetical protein
MFLVNVQRPSEVVVGAKLNSKIGCHHFLEEREKKHIIRKPEHSVVATHANDRLKHVVAEQELEARCTRSVMALNGEMRDGIAEVQNRTASLGIMAQETSYTRP